MDNDDDQDWVAEMEEENEMMEEERETELARIRKGEQKVGSS